MSILPEILYIIDDKNILNEKERRQNQHKAERSFKDMEVVFDVVGVTGKLSSLVMGEQHRNVRCAMKNIMKKFSLHRIMNAIALFLAIDTVNSACMWIMYQPEVPEEMDEYKKK